MAEPAGPIRFQNSHSSGANIEAVAPPEDPSHIAEGARGESREMEKVSAVQTGPLSRWIDVTPAVELQHLD